jgi:acyl-CoA synthetase (AMP-forming)/AMP-acid ligase II
MQVDGLVMAMTERVDARHFTLKLRSSESYFHSKSQTARQKRMLNFLLDNASAAFPLKVALIFQAETYTYAELCGLTKCLAASLLERGINPKDRIAFLLPNCPQIVLCYYACFKIGAIAVPLNIRFRPELLKYVINHSGTRVLISEPELFAPIDKMRSSLPGIEQYYLTSGHSQFDDVRPFDELLKATFDADRLPRFEENNAAAIYYTSGTTGLPKAVIHSHASLARATQIQIDQIAISSDDRTLIMFPVCYLIGFGSQILPFHSRGATCVLLPYFEPRLVLGAIQTYQPTKTYGFPQLYNDLVNWPEASEYNLRSLNFCFSAGEAIPVAIQERFKRIFGVEITEGCGMTELQIYSMNPPYGEKKIGSIGRPIAGIQVSLIDDSDSPIAGAHKIGEIIVQGGSMTTGYWRDPELTARNIRQGWFHTGDLAYRDEDDFYWFVSRKSEIIKHQAGLVSPIEIEGVLYQHPAVREAGVIGVPDRFGHELPQAHVVLQKSSAPVTEQQLIDLARIRLPEHKVPCQIIFADNLPHGPTGKIDRKTLREHALNLRFG